MSVLDWIAYRCYSIDQWYCCTFGRYICRWFGHSWHYQSVELSDRVGELPARCCCRCMWRYCERLHPDGIWKYDDYTSIPF